MNRYLPSILLFAALAASPLHALPEDAEQDMVISSDRSELFLDQGRVVHYGTAEVPAEISQGSLHVSGLELVIEQEEGELRRVIATGEPARFQQQPEADQAVVHASGRTIVFDNVSRRLVIEEEATLNQEGRGTTTGRRIEYEMDTRRISAEGGVQAVIPPRALEDQDDDQGPQSQ